MNHLLFLTLTAEWNVITANQVEQQCGIAARAIRHWSEDEKILNWRHIKVTCDQERA